jgi:hypothetical protein
MEMQVVSYVYLIQPCVVRCILSFFFFFFLAFMAVDTQFQNPALAYEYPSLLQIAVSSLP